MSQQTIPLLKTQPRETQIEILSQLPLPTLLKLCSTDRYFSTICSDDYLWKELVLTRYGDIAQVGTSWRETFISQYQILDPLIELMGLENFLHFTLRIFASNMIVFPEVVKKYKVPLTPQEISLIEQGDSKQTFDIYAQYTQGRQAPNPFDIYGFIPAAFYDRDLIHNMTELDVILEDLPANPSLFFYTEFPIENIPKLMELLSRLYDPEFLQRFLNAPIPGLHDLTIINPNGIDYDPQVLFSLDFETQQPALNILETRESPEIMLPAAHITLLEILILIMSIKTSKSFEIEHVYGIKSFDVKRQVLTVDIQE